MNMVQWKEKREDQLISKSLGQTEGGEDHAARPEKASSGADKEGSV